MEKAYITGASGFIGKHLTERLDEFVTIPHEKIKTIKLKPFERFFFLSTYGNMSFHDDDKKILQANILDLIHILETMERDFKSFVFISTSSVRLPRQTMYSRSKKAAEEILLSYMEKYNLPVCIIRPFSITGVGEQKEHLIPTLMCLMWLTGLLTYPHVQLGEFLNWERANKYRTKQY